MGQVKLLSYNSHDKLMNLHSNVTTYIHICTHVYIKTSSQRRIMQIYSPKHNYSVTRHIRFLKGDPNVRVQSLQEILRSENNLILPSILLMLPTFYTHPLSFVFLFLLSFIYLFERLCVCEQRKGQKERERDKQTPCEYRTQDSKIMIRAKILRIRSLND